MDGEFVGDEIRFVVETLPAGFAGNWIRLMFDETFCVHLRRLLLRGEYARNFPEIRDKFVHL